MYTSLPIPFVGWVSLETLHGGRRWKPTISRGRRQDREVQVPFGWWAVTFHGNGKRYVDLVDAPSYLRRKDSVDWILDEFDASFNDLAIASLRYHLDYSVCSNEENRATYEDLIARLSEEHPRVCDNDAEHDIYEASGGVTRVAATPERQALSARYRQREDGYAVRMNQARHDWIDILPGLWS